MILLSTFSFYNDIIISMNRISCFLFIQLFFFLSLESLQAQTDEIDSLKNELVNHTEEDSLRVDILNRLCWKNRNTNFGQAIDYANEARQIAKKINYQDAIAQNYNFIGVVYRNLGDYQKAMGFYFEALKIAENIQNQEQLAYANNNIGEIYKFQEEYEKAIEFTEKAITAFQEINNETGLAYGYIRLGEIYEAQGKYQEAITAFENSLEIRQRLGELHQIGSSQARLGEVYFLMENHEKAIQYFEESIQTREKTNNPKGISGTLAKLALLSREKGDLEKSLDYAKKGYDISKELGALAYLEENSFVLAQIYADKLDFKKAHFYQQTYAETLSQRLKDENDEKFAIQRANYQLNQKENEIARQQEIQKLTQNTFIIAIGLTLIILFIITFFLLRYRRINRVLQEKRKEIQYKNDALQTSQTQLRRNTKKLEFTNLSLQNTLDELKQTQTQLIETEKKAAISQLVSSVSNEFDTPLTALNNSAHNLAESVDFTLKKLPDILQNTDIEVQKNFWQMIILSSQKGQETSVLLNSADKRKNKRQLRSTFAEWGSDSFDSEEVADFLTDLNYTQLPNELLPILQQTNYQELLKAIYHFSSIRGDSQNIQESVEKIARVVYALGEVSPKDIVKAKEEYFVVQNLQSIIQDYRENLSDKVQIEESLDNEVTIEANPEEMNQVWVNLMKNAVQAVDYHGKIQVSMKQNSKNVFVTIKDDGKGIPINVQPKIFEPFFTTKTLGEGSGLGLYLVKKIIEDHQGVISFDSKAGKGSTFEVYFPVRT